MRHRVSGYKLGRKTGSRKALYRILLNECIKRGKIRTTMSKAKAVQPKLEKLITLGRKGSVNDKRKAYSIVNNTEITNELFNVVSKRFETRDSGFTRITKLGLRDNDRAPVSIIEFVESIENPQKEDSEVLKTEK